MGKSNPDIAKMSLFAATPEIESVVKRALGHFTKNWKPGGFDLIVIATKKGTGSRAAAKIREALEVD